MPNFQSRFLIRLMGVTLLVLALTTVVSLHADQIDAQATTAAPPGAVTAHNLFLPAVFHQYCASPIVDDFTNPASGWPIADTGSVIYRYLDSEYNIYHRNGDFWTAVTRGDVWIPGSKYLEAQGRIVQNDGIWGLLFAASDGWSDFYTIEINPNDQRWYVIRYTSSGGWQLVATGQSYAIQPGTSLNTIRLGNHGDVLVLNINHHQFVWVSSQLVTASGRVGLTGASFQANVDIRYTRYVFVDKNCPLPSQLNCGSLFREAITLERPNLDSLLTE